MPIDVHGLAPGRQRYGLLTDAAGGILDDLMVANRGDHFLLVVNAARKADDLAHLGAELGAACARRAARARAPGAAGPEGRGGARRAPPRRGRHALHGCARHRPRRHAGGGLPLRLHRRGRLRDSRSARRTPATSPSGCSPRPTCCRSASAPATRCASRPGCASTGTTSTRRRRRSRRRSNGRSSRRGAAAAPGSAASRAPRSSSTRSPPARRGAGSGFARRAVPRCARAPSSSPRRRARRSAPITSGGFGPSLDAPVAMGYVPIGQAAPGTRLLGRLRGKMHAVTVAKMPMIEPGYRRA